MKKIALLLIVLLTTEMTVNAQDCSTCGEGKWLGGGCMPADCEKLENCFYGGIDGTPESCHPCSEIKTCEDYMNVPNIGACNIDTCNKRCANPNKDESIRACVTCDENFACSVFTLDECPLRKCCYINEKGNCYNPLNKLDIAGGDESVGLQSIKCDCKCQGVPICSVGLAPKGRTAYEAFINCQKQCARTCGGYADYKGDCETNCGAYCNNNPEGYQSTASGTDRFYPSSCTESCKSGCEIKKLVQDITTMIYMVAGIIGAVMLIIHAIRYASSSDPHGRNDAKKSMAAVLIALVIMALAGWAVGLFTGLSGAKKPTECAAVTEEIYPGGTRMAAECIAACAKIGPGYLGLCVQTSPDSSIVCHDPPSTPPFGGDVDNANDKCGQVEDRINDPEGKFTYGTCCCEKI